MNRDIFSEFPVFKSDRLEFKDVKEQDADALKEIIYYGSFKGSGLSITEILEKLAESYKAGYSINWGLYLDGELAGTCGYYRGFKDDTGEVGYIMREKFRRRGLMEEAVRRVISFGFEKMELKLITAYTSDDNEQSKSLLKKIGFKETDSFVKEFRRYELKDK